MNLFLCSCILFFILLQGCNQQSSKDKDDDFKNYANSNTEQLETTNQQSNAIINIAF